MGVLYTEDFADISGYTTIGSGSAAPDATNIYMGAQAVALTATDGFGWMKADVGMAIDATAADTWGRVVFYVPTAKGGWLYLFLYSNNSLTSFGQVWLKTLNAGWHVIEFPVPLVDADGGDGKPASTGYDPSNITGLGFYFYSAENQVLTVANVQFMQPDATDLPTFILTLDDGNATQTSIISAFDTYGWKAAVGVCGTLIDAGGLLTVAQLLTMQANGHKIVSHSYTHTDWDELTLLERETEILLNQRWLEERGFPANADILTIPYGFYGGTDLSEQIDTMDMVMRHNRCVFDTVARFPPRFSQQVNSNQILGYAPHHQKNYLARLMFDKGVTTATIDTAISFGSGVIPIGFHWVGNGNATYYTVAEFQALCLYLREQELAGLCRVMSVSEWLGQTSKVWPATLTGLTFVEALKLLTANQETIKSVQPDYAPVVDSSGNSAITPPANMALNSTVTAIKAVTDDLASMIENA